MPYKKNQGTIYDTRSNILIYIYLEISLKIPTWFLSNKKKAG